MNIKSVEKFVQNKIDPTFHFTDNREKIVPFTNLYKDLSNCKIALISSGGLYLKKSQEPFNTENVLGDVTYRKIPKEVSMDVLEIAHTHYDHKYVREDLNTVMPLEIFRNLEEDNTIGEFSSINYSFCGYIIKDYEIINNLGPKIAKELKENNVDAAILAPVWPICNQSVGLLARALEETGISTVTLNMFPEVSEYVIPPRTIRTKFVFGSPFGYPNNKEVQYKVIRESLELLKDTKPGIVKDFKWKQDI